MESKCKYCGEEHKNNNTGCCNSGRYNGGWFNTNEPKMRFFNMESDITYSEFIEGRVVYPDLKICDWVSFKDLPEIEKTKKAKQMGGLLKTLSYKDAWKEYWSRISEEDKKWFMSLPNFSPVIFEEITGIYVGSKSLSGKKVKVELDGKSYTATLD